MYSIFMCMDLSFEFVRFVQEFLWILFESLEEIFLIAKFEYLILSDRILDDIFPGWIYTESFYISKYYAEILCSWKTDINSSEITDKSYGFSSILFNFFVTHYVPGTYCTKNNDIFFIGLGRNRLFLLHIFCFYRSESGGRILVGCMVRLYRYLRMFLINM